MPSPERSNRTYRAVARVVRPALFSMTRPHWAGTENLPRTGGFIAAVNHVTTLDPLTFAHFLWDAGYAPRIMAKDSLFRVPGLGRIMRSIDLIPVARGSAQAAQSLELAAAALAAGECLAVFPEGTLTRDPDLWPMVAKTGVARLALATRAPVVPVGQWGAHRVLGQYAKVLKPVPRKRVDVVAGPAVDLSDLYDRPREAAVIREATSRIMAAVTGLVAGLRAEAAPEAVFDLRTGARTAEP
ncbi:MAG: 1-acyl-sn-glycerol-3-phosphate acyltransferase [Actinobacteria bacterium]|nr:1-acyl-sn-glycerol-3-phosphate acyltransferase [Actinomycetota bacterium]MCG2803243.1 1-acyl-sn-glycerol-3-phosphate acyltransferase [Cellulomonas sp.]